MVADALNKKSSSSLAHISVERRPLIQELYKLVDQGLMIKISILREFSSVQSQISVEG